MIESVSTHKNCVTPENLDQTKPIEPRNAPSENQMLISCCIACVYQSKNATNYFNKIGNLLKSIKALISSETEITLSLTIGDMSIEVGGDDIKCADCFKDDHSERQSK